MVLREKDGGEVRELLKEHKMLEHRQVRLADGEVLVELVQPGVHLGVSSGGRC